MPFPFRFVSLFAAACVAAAFSSAPVLAGVILPSDPGLTYRIAFVTSVGVDAMNTNIGAYNQFVADHAPTGDPLLSGLTWTAIASTQSVSAIANTFTQSSDASYPIYDTNGDLIAAGNSGLWSGTLDHAIDYNEQGALMSGYAVWTGTDPTGHALYPLGSSVPGVGVSNYSDLRWTDDFTQFSTSPFRLYGLSSPITNPDISVPEPSTLPLLGAALLALGGAAWLQRRRRLKVQG